MKFGDEFLWREWRIVTHPGARPRVLRDLSVCGPVNLPFFFIRPRQRLRRAAQRQTVSPV